MNHIEYMKKALKLAERAENVSPNPAVGAILVKNGQIIGEGFHRGPGTIHAEIDAIENADGSVRGSILYTTLEPCCSSYEGKNQPPCTERIISEGILEVFVSLVDPNPKVKGNGIKQLRQSGITVISGILEEETKILNEIYIKNMNESLPFIQLKVAQTIDGNIATSTGDSKWITDLDARKNVHHLRSQFDAILIGSGTAEFDNPLLTIRNGASGHINRLVVDSSLRLPINLNVFDDQLNNPTTVFTSNQISQKGIIPYLEKGIRIIKLPITKNGQLNLNELLKCAFKNGIRSILVEGGSAIFTSFIQAKLYDKISFYIAPKLSGPGIHMIEKMSIPIMENAINIKKTNVKLINNQILLTGYRV